MVMSLGLVSFSNETSKTQFHTNFDLGNTGEIDSIAKCIWASGDYCFEGFRSETRTMACISR